jgi:DNA primase
MSPSSASWDDAKEQVKARLNLVDLVSQHVRLRKQGREHVGLCPFHQEKTPSLWVNEQNQSWYCFGCQKGGDIIKWQQEIEKTDFRGALQSLAELAGVELAEERGADRERNALRKRIVEMNGLAARYYEYVLWGTEAGQPGRELLAKRDVSEEVARSFGLGYAPAGAGFAAYLRRRGRTIADAQAAGLVRRDSSDFFSERVMIPIRDERGQPLAFTGRTVRPDEQRKYVNSPETPAYVKGRVLFALDVAREGIREKGHSVLMEGQFDVIVAHGFGITNAVAASGTALTEEQVKLLKRFTEEVVLVFDNDRAGRSATFAAIEKAAEGGLRTRAGLVTGGAKDPDEFLRGGGDWDGVLRAAQPGWEFWIRDSISELNTHRPDQLDVALRRVDEILAKIADPAVRDQYRALVPQWIDADPAVLMRRLGTARPAGRPQPSGGGTRPAAPPADATVLSAPVAYLVGVLAARPDAALRVREGLRPEDLGDEERGPFTTMVESLIQGGQAFDQALPGWPDEIQHLVRRALAHPPHRVDDATVDDVVARIRKKAGQRRRNAIISDLRDAVARGDRELVSSLETRLREMTREGQGR